MIVKKYRNHIFAVAIVVVLLDLAFGAGILRVQRDKMIDLLFTRRPQPTDIVIVAIDDASIRSVGQWPWPRSVFGALVKKLDGATVIGIDVNFKETSRLGAADDGQFAAAMRSIKTPVVLNAEINAQGQPEMPIAVLAAASRQAFPNLLIDTDGIARSALTEKGGLPSLSLRLAQLYRNGIQVPALFRIIPRGPDGSIAHIAAADVLKGAIPPAFYQHKIVLIGATASDLQDFHNTPFGIMSGVEIQANIAQTILDGRFFRRSDTVDLGLVLVLSLLVVAICTRIRKLSRLLAALVGIIITYNIVAFLIFDRFFILDLLYPNLAILITAGLCLTIQYMSEAKEKKFIQETFSKYLAPEVVRELLSDTSRLKLGGQKKTLSILFSDIRGFTALSETMAPEALAQFLNRYLTLMTEVVFKEKGVIDKYIGDAIMAFWGAPVDNANHAHDAVATALDMMEALARFNEENKAQNLPAIEIGIGVNSGEVTVGNMGGEKRFDYTAIGDTVNLASRLEGLNKLYGTNIIVSEITKQGAGDIPGVMFREIDQVKVKGKNASVRIFEVVPRSRQEGVRAYAAEFQAALESYYAGRWQESLAEFSGLVQTHQDKAAQVFVRRCREMLDSPPAEPWTGVWELTEK